MPECRLPANSVSASMQNGTFFHMYTTQAISYTKGGAESESGSLLVPQLVIRLFAPLLVFTLSSLFSSNANELTNWPL